MNTLLTTDQADLMSRAAQNPHGQVKVERPVGEPRGRMSAQERLVRHGLLKFVNTHVAHDRGVETAWYGLTWAGWLAMGVCPSHRRPLQDCGCRLATSPNF